MVLTRETKYFLKLINGLKTNVETMNKHTDTNITILSLCTLRILESKRPVFYILK